jgi:hypothetical protein
MNEENVQNLTERLLADDDLLGRFQQDPVAVAREHELELSDEQETKLAGQSLHEQSSDDVKATLTREGCEAWL